MSAWLSIVAEADTTGGGRIHGASWTAVWSRCELAAVVGAAAPDLPPASADRTGRMLAFLTTALGCRGRTVDRAHLARSLAALPQRAVASLLGVPLDAERLRRMVDRMPADVATVEISAGAGEEHPALVLRAGPERVAILVSMAVPASRDLDAEVCS